MYHHCPAAYQTQFDVHPIKCCFLCSEMKDERRLLLFNAETDMKNIFVNSFFHPQIILLQATLSESQ